MKHVFFFTILVFALSACEQTEFINPAKPMPANEVYTTTTADVEFNSEVELTMDDVRNYKATILIENEFSKETSGKEVDLTGKPDAWITDEHGNVAPNIPFIKELLDYNTVTDEFGNQSPPSIVVFSDEFGFTGTPEIEKGRACQNSFQEAAKLACQTGNWTCTQKDRVTAYVPCNGFSSGCLAYGIISKRFIFVGCDHFSKE